MYALLSLDYLRKNKSINPLSEWCGVSPGEKFNFLLKMLNYLFFCGDLFLSAYSVMRRNRYFMLGLSICNLYKLSIILIIISNCVNADACVGTWAN